MDGIVREVGIGITGDEAPLRESLENAVKHLKQFETVVLAISKTIGGGLDKVLGKVGTSADSVSTRVNKMADSVETAAIRTDRLSTSLTSLNTVQKEVRSSSDRAGNAIIRLGEKTTAGMTKVTTAVKDGRDSFLQLSSLINTVRNAAQQPINLRFTGTGGGGSGAGGGRGHGMAGEFAAGALAAELAKKAVDKGAEVTMEAAKLQTDLMEVRNNTEMTDAEFDQLRKTTIALGVETGAKFDQIAQAYMRAKNFGFDAADSMEIVATATKSAVGSGADLDKTGEILASVMHNFKQSGSEAMVTMNLLHQAALLGNTTLEEFVNAGKPVLSLAAGLGLSLRDTLAVFSALTKAGFDAAESATQLKNIMTHITTPTKEARTEIAALSKASGVDLVKDFSASGLASRGLIGVLKDMQDATRGNEDAVMRLIGAQRGGIGAFILTKNGFGDITHAAESFDEAISGKINPTMEGFERQQQTMQASLDKLKNRLVAAIDNGFLKFLTDGINEGREWIDILDGIGKGIDNAFKERTVPEWLRMSILGYKYLYEAIKETAKLTGQNNQFNDSAQGRKVNDANDPGMFTDAINNLRENRGLSPDDRSNLKSRLVQSYGVDPNDAAFREDSVLLGLLAAKLKEAMARRSAALQSFQQERDAEEEKFADDLAASLSHPSGGGGHKPAPAGPLPALSALHTLKMPELTESIDATGPTSAENFAQKLERLNDLFAQHRARLIETKQSYSKYDIEVGQLMQRLRIENEAIAATSGEIVRLNGVIEKQAQVTQQLITIANGERATIQAKRRAKQALTAEDINHYNNAQAAAEGAIARLKEDNKALDLNKRIHHQATQDKIRDIDSLSNAETRHKTEVRKRFLENLKTQFDQRKISRDQYEQELAAALGRIEASGDKNGEDYKAFESALNQSKTSRVRANAQIEDHALGADPHNYEARRKQLENQLEEKRQSGADETHLKTFEAMERKKIDDEEFKYTQDRIRETHEANMQAGLESVQQLRAVLAQQLDAYTAYYGASSEEVAKLNLEIAKIDFELIAENARTLEHQLDSGAISLQQYIAALQQLEQQLPRTSSQFRQVERQIEEASQRMRANARRTGDEIGSQVAEGVVGAIRSNKSLGQVLADWLSEAADSMIKRFIKKKISDLVMKTILKQDDASVKEAANKMDDASNKMVVSIGAFATGVAAFTLSVNRFVSAAASGGAARGVPMPAGSIGGGNTGNNLSQAGTLASAAPNPYVQAAGTALTVAGLAYSFFASRSQKPDFVTRTAQSRYGSVGYGDHTGVIDSGYSGVDGMRLLRSERTNNFSKGSIVVYGQGQDPGAIARQVVREISRSTAIGNSLVPSG